MIFNAFTAYHELIILTAVLRFRVSFRRNKITLKSIQYRVVCDRCSVNRNVYFHTFLFFINSHIFRHLKLEIALAIPASNDEKKDRLDVTFAWQI